MGGAHFGGDMSGYFDQLSLSTNRIGGTMENMVRHFQIEQPPYLGSHYPVCLTWSSYQQLRGDGEGPSGTQGHEDDD